MVLLGFQVIVFLFCWFFEPSRARNLPSSFDSRVQWSNCTTISEVRTMDPDCTKSNWAFALAATMSDRICIQLNKQVVLSPYNLLACCKKCTSNPCEENGVVTYSWDYFIQTGICTGDDENNGCQPYETTKNPTTCSTTCTNPNYGTTYDNDLYFGESAYSIAPGAGNIQVEIFTNGPVMALMDQYTDFDEISKSVYAPSSTATKVDQIAVKIIGWGTDDQVPFWLATYFQGTQWADQGFFRIVRGNNTCNIETYAYAGTALMPAQILSPSINSSLHYK